MSDTITPQAGDTAADLKMKIEKMQAEKNSKGSSVERSSQSHSSTSNSESKAKADASQNSQPAGADSTGEKTSPNNDVDLQKWAKSKGIDWTSETSVLEALRRSDQEFHKRQQEKRKDIPNNPAPSYSQPSYQPNGYQPSPNGYQQNGYVPPAPPPQLPRQALEQIARNYNLSVEDAERLIAFNNDFVESKLNIERQRMQKEFDQLKQSNRKNDVFRELSSDPTFRNPQVIQEYYKTVEELQDHDPRLFEEDPNAYRKAYDQALINIARRNLQGEVGSNQPQVNSYGFPTNPPRPIGTGGTGEMHKENEITDDQFRRLSSEDQRAVLTRMGLVSSKY